MSLFDLIMEMQQFAGKPVQGQVARIKQNPWHKDLNSYLEFHRKRQRKYQTGGSEEGKEPKGPSGEAHRASILRGEASIAARAEKLRRQNPEKSHKDLKREAIIALDREHAARQAAEQEARLREREGREQRQKEHEAQQVNVADQAKRNSEVERLADGIRVYRPDGRTSFVPYNRNYRPTDDEIRRSRVDDAADREFNPERKPWENDPEAWKYGKTECVSLFDRVFLVESDEMLRRIERLAAQGDPVAIDRLQHERSRRESSRRGKIGRRGK